MGRRFALARAESDRRAVLSTLEARENRGWGAAGARQSTGSSWWWGPEGGFSGRALARRGKRFRAGIAGPLVLRTETRGWRR